MARPPIPLGTNGTVKTTRTPVGWESRTRFRQLDGTTRQLRAAAHTKIGAENAIKARVRDLRGGLVSSGESVTDLGDLWLSRIENDPAKSSQTRRQYDHVWRNHVRPALGSVRLVEVRPSIVNRALDHIATTAGSATAKTSRTVLSGMFAYAVTNDIVDRNPVRDTNPISGTSTKQTRALTVVETERVIDDLRASPFAVQADLPDLAEWMLGFGCRIGEAVAARHGMNPDGRPVLDYDAAALRGTWEINATVVWSKGVGLFIQPRPKTEAGWRVLAMPPYCVEMLARRETELRLDGPSGVVFGAPRKRGLRGTTNAQGDLRRALDMIDCDVCDGTGRVIVDGEDARCDAGPFAWVTSHTFRKTVATRLDEAGFTARQIADQLGHARPSMTQDVYMGRQVVNADAARVLNR